ncbi:hypothetical protein ES705_46534 [subsurface metagenome]
MKRAIPLLYILLTMTAPAEERFFRSNQIGMALQEIAWYRRDEHLYILEVKKEEVNEGFKEIRRLVHSGEEVKRWELLLDVQGRVREERSYEKERLSDFRLMDELGRMILEEKYDHAKVKSRVLFYYSSAGLSRVEYFDEEGNLLYEDRYRLGAFGELLEVKRVEPEIPAVLFSLTLVQAQGLTYEERLKDRERSYISRYNSDGELFSYEVWKDGDLEKSLYVIDNEHYSEEIDYLNNRKYLRHYDDSGRLVLEEAEYYGEIVERVELFWDEEDRMLRKIRRGNIGIEEWNYRYNSSGKLQDEDYLLRGSLVRRVEYPDEERRLEELFRDDELFMKIYYTSGIKEKEQVLREGKVIRERLYGGGE